MTANQNFPSLSHWADRVEAVLVAAVGRLTVVRSGIFWTLSYVILLALMYLFHSPFRAQVNTRTDWYAQLTKGLQIWLGVVLLCFHVGPHLYVSHSTHARSSNAATMAQRMFVEDTVASIFFPTFCFNSFLFLMIHKFKRRYTLAFTYGPSLTLILINSVLLATFAAMHYTVCEELFSTVVPAVAASNSVSGKVRAATVDRASRIVCPRPVNENPFQCIAFLSTICVVFVVVDYVYKACWADGNPSRGILWAELYPPKPKSESAVGGAPASGAITAPMVLHWWRALRAREEHLDLSAQLHLREGDPRLKESLPKTIRFNHRHGMEAINVACPDGWRDKQDQLSEAAEKYMLQPTNRPGMVPWFSTFIFNTTWQTIARLALDFLTFDVRILQKNAAPKVFHLHFAKSLATLPRLPPLPTPHDDINNSTVKQEEKERQSKSAEGTAGQRSDAPAVKSPEQRPRKTAESTPPKSPSPAPKKTTSPATTPSLLPSMAATAAQEGEADAKPDVWFDWIADVGDGFNSTYSMARLLAQPFLRLPWHHPSTLLRGLARLTGQCDVTPPESSMTEDTLHYLPRGSFVVVGGDLAYPSPNDETFTTRLFVPYRDALSDNAHLKGLYSAAQPHVVAPGAEDKDVAHMHLLDAMTVSKMASGRSGLPRGTASTEVALRSVPLLFAIPGNHDWFDGLGTYMKYILERTWIGGWLMPQKSSYFVLRLPYNWFMLCLDAGCEQDIDAAQRNYFLDVIEKYMNEESCVILSIHEPSWIYDSMLHADRLMQPETSRLCEALGTRLRMQLAGDIHNYSRHVPRDASTEAPMLVVSGGGGAFMHGPRLTPVVAHCAAYRRACAFPASNTLGTLLSRLLGFRVINWKFDLIIGVCCFMVVVSLLPQSIKDTHRGASPVVLATLPDAAGVWWERTCTYIDLLFSRGVASVVATVLFFVAFTAAGTEKSAALWKRGLHASFWTGITVLICCGMLSLLLCTMEYMVDNRLLVSSKAHWGSAVEDQVRLTVDSLLNHTQVILGGTERSRLALQIRRVQNALYGRALVNWGGIFLRCLDPLEMLAYLSEKVSADEMGSFVAGASRIDEVLYYLYFLFFYWILVTPLVSFVIGSYLVCSVTFFDCMYDATYSAFQIEEFKNFVRFKIDATTRELHAYVVTMRHVPKAWHWDAAHQAELKSDVAKFAPPHLRANPSRWNGRPFRAGAGLGGGGGKDGLAEKGNEDGAEILEHFVCSPHVIPGVVS
ncbi:hypothetical protein ABB37_08658 [Leptomonas pyrrhocoris]|uniref:Calcineurin-like phosphoesterase domain-containing protein n=1 Tax=Leptomonas pyrrhocoris TaxID=157538 RepID=A0A0M9FSU5_LEPPY|nr:hypothetical protein ABB37_08658 [Leptomonas pyrrhocoris]KPA75380.1 hypothetical protein ABB37_08658 [Leptomonas pyrrhocoris]|eukprot:XP_015653819.1 hypothetical protein ABB37_08658 [Leptomonas pyrrhocoris]